MAKKAAKKIPPKVTPRVARPARPVVAPDKPLRPAAKAPVAVASKTKAVTVADTLPPRSVAAPPPPAVASAEIVPDASTEKKPARRSTAEAMGQKQRDISVSEFFTKNRHLLGFDNPAKALLTTVKEAVDNSLDACEEAGILPELRVEIREVAEGRFRVAVEDNGPGIVKAQIPKIFAKLLYGSKFHRLRQSRGQQGIGISAAGLYAQLTTGKPVVIISKTGKGKPAHRIELRIDTKHNQPDVVKDVFEPQWAPEHGTRVELELVAAYRGGRTGVDSYLEQTVVANPHLGLTYVPPKGEPVVYPRVSNELPREPQEIKPHPHGVELGMLLNMLHDADDSTVKQVLSSSFSRVSASVAEDICRKAKVDSKAKSTSIHGDDVDRLHKALGEVKLMAPPTSSVVPIGEDLLKAGLARRFPNAEFMVSATRPPSVYRGNPFVVEVGLAYGGDLPRDEPAEIMRFANRVPLQYQPKSCAISESIYQTNWKAYELQQPKGSLPVGPIAIAVHLASVWVPFTSEAKEAVAHYDDLLKEMRLAVQECGRKLGAHLRARDRAASEQKRLSIFQRYIPEVSAAIANIIKGDKAAIAQSFHQALPNYVKITPEEPESGAPPAADGASSAVAGGGPASPALPPAPKVKPGGKPAPKSRKDQLSLI